jgi:Protein of unknown function (DUF3303)
MPQTTYMIIEHFRNGDAVPVYRRYRERGRMAPDGLSYVASWVTSDMTRCYQIMEAPDRALLEEWISNWSDLVEFEVHPVITSKEASDRIGPKL